MAALSWQRIRHFQPGVGWPQAILALLVVLCPALAAMESDLRLPTGVFFWAGLLGLIVGGDSGLHALQQPEQNTHTPKPYAQHIARLRRIIHAFVWVAIGALIVAAAGAALPPFGLLLQDLSLLIDRMYGRAPAAEAPMGYTTAFLSAALARFSQELAIAPANGERGAQLLIATIGSALTWLGALVLGYALPSKQTLALWSLPLLAALTLIAILGESGGWPLALGLGLMLLLTSTTSFRSRVRNWDRTKTDFSDELGRDVAVWSTLLITIMLVAAWMLPLWPGNPVAKALQDLIDPPSGLAVFERGLERPGSLAPTAEIGISTLPSLFLGISLEQGPPEQPALRVRLDRPLPESGLPYYWRVRVFNNYTGTTWSAHARVSPEAASPTQSDAFAGAIGQEIEDLRPDKQLLIGIPDIIGVSIPTNAERFEDGSLAALAGNPPEARYRVLSRAQELAPGPQADREQPDMSPYLGLPRNLPPRVGELATALASNRRGAYAQALALEDYLRKLPYSYTVEPIPRDGDAVDLFLFEMRSGYCTYYASSMIVLARSLGIPARLAVGYATGERSPDGRYLVYERDAHAWPELYIDGRWTVFEPTPIRQIPGRGITEPETSLEPTPVPETPPDRVTGPLIWLAVLVLVIALSVVAWRYGRRPPEPPPILQAQLRLEQYGHQVGVAWPPGATLQEYRALLAPHLNHSIGTTNKDATEALRELVHLIELVRYGGHELSPDEQQQLLIAGERVWGGS